MKSLASASSTFSFAVGLHAERTPREDVPVGAVVNLRRAIERVLVALRTLEPHAEERGRSLLAPLVRRQRLLATPEEVERLFLGVGRAEALDHGVVYGPVLRDVLLDRLAVAAGRRQDVLDDLVVGHVLGDALAEPVVPRLAEARARRLLRGDEVRLQGVGVVAGDVAELGRPQGRVHWMGEQF